MAAQKQFPSTLRVFVVCSGLIYGNGELNSVFYEMFRRSWLCLHEDLARLPIVGEGFNRVPTIHVVDLARSVKFILENRKQME